MGSEIAVRDESVMLPAYRDMSAEQRSLLKEVCSSAQLNDNQFALLIEVARRAGLDPFRRHLYGLFFEGKFTLVTGIDGFRAVARRNGLAGMDDVVYTWNEEKDPDHTFPVTATITVYRYGPRGEREPYTATARWREYVRFFNNKKTGKREMQSNWRDKPCIMLGKVAEALALRKAFTESLGGVYERAEFGAHDHERERMSSLSNDPVPLEHIIDTTAQPEHVEGWDDSQPGPGGDGDAP